MSIEQVERVLLGTMLLDADAIDTAAELSAHELLLDSHRVLIRIIREMHAKGVTVDPLTIMAELDRRRLMDSVGGVGYVGDLTSDVWKGRDVTAQVRLIKHEAARRGLYAACNAAMKRAQDGEDPEALIAALRADLDDTQQRSLVARALPLSELVVSAWEAMREQMERSDTLLGIPTGIPELDETMQGWQPGELTYFGGLPGRGKSAFFVQCMHTAATSGFGVGCISLEMRSNQLVRRLGVLSSNVGPRRFRDPKLMSQDQRRIAKAAVYALGDLPIQVCDQSGLSPGAITALARRMRDGGAKVIFVDFVQIVREDGQNRREAIDRISAALRDAAKTMNIPFVVASQLARRGDQEREPRLQDLKESGSLEQDAHNVLFVHRPQREDNEWSGEDKIIIAKQREGVVGEIAVTFDEQTLTFQARRMKSPAHVNPLPFRAMRS